MSLDIEKLVDYLLEDESIDLIMPLKMYAFQRPGWEGQKQDIVQCLQNYFDKNKIDLNEILTQVLSKVQGRPQSGSGVGRNRSPSLLREIAALIEEESSSECPCKEKNMEDLVCFLEFLARSQVGSKINETMKRSKFKQSIASCLKLETLESFSQNPNFRDDEAMGLLFGEEYNKGEIFRAPLKQANTPGTAASPEPADRRDHPVEMQLACFSSARGSSNEITPVPYLLPGQVFP